MLDGTDYMFEDGMNWERWVESDYNMGNYIIDAIGQLATEDNQPIMYIGTQDYVYGTDLIVIDGTYGLN